MPKDGILKMSYIEQAKKRNHCIKLVKFLLMIDYLIVTVKRDILWNSYNELIQNFKLHTDVLPLSEKLKNLKISQVLEIEKPSDFPHEVMNFK